MVKSHVQGAWKIMSRIRQNKRDRHITILDLDGIKCIPRDKVVIYARIVVDYRPQKKDPNRVRIAVGGNLIQYPGELTTRTADMRTSKIMWNSTISTMSARYMVADAGNFYLATPMERKEYLRIAVDLIPTRRGTNISLAHASQ